MSPTTLRRPLYAWAYLGLAYPNSTRLIRCPDARAGFKAGAIRRNGRSR